MIFHNGSYNHHSYLMREAACFIIYAEFSSDCCYIYACVLPHIQSAGKAPLGKELGRKLQMV